MAAYSGETVYGRVIAILPETSVETRTTRVRVELPNPNLRLRPGMFAQLRLHAGDDTPRLWVPSEASLRGVLARLNSPDAMNNTGAKGAENARDLPQGAMRENAAPMASSSSMNSPAAMLHEATGKVESITDREI